MRAHRHAVRVVDPASRPPGPRSRRWAARPTRPPSRPTKAPRRGHGPPSTSPCPSPRGSGRRLCPRTNLYTRMIESIDLERQRVVAAAGFGSQQRFLEYDQLVIALGSVTTFAGQPGLAEHALPFKYLGDALVLRNHAIHVLEEADIEGNAEMRKSLLTFVVAGGGFSGVEAVAELNDFVRAAAKGFRNVMPDEIRVVLLHAGPVILPEL